MDRLLISAAHKSSGKTTVSIGLSRALRMRGLAVQPYKKGPDYIDPMWLAQASGRACRNLDLHLMARDEIARMFAREAVGADLCLVEGNKGLYDGLALDGRDSNAALAALLALPVVLVLDARGMTRGIAPLILGYQAFDRDIAIGGVILNHVGGARHEAKLRAVIEHYTDVPVVGAIQHDENLVIVERHLGLVPSNEAGDADAKIDRLGESIVAQVDLDRLLSIAAAAPAREERALPPPAQRGEGLGEGRSRRSDVRVGIARDRAFGFYYADDLEALAAAGAEIVPFDTLGDSTLPAVDGLFIGGGFPESFLDALEANALLRAQIRTAIEQGLPVYAECGGLMYLARTLSWRGRCAAMVGALPFDVVMHDRPVGRGYVEVAETPACPWPRLAQSPATVRAHEFHYSSVEHLRERVDFAYDVRRGHGIDGRHDGIVHRNVVASYAHRRSVGGDDWAARFVAFVREVKRQRLPCGRVAGSGSIPLAAAA
jgi:cobyrinic acid a,c-diamide synthase